MGFLSALRHDRRLVTLTAALGGVALLASLVSEWQVTALDATLFRSGLTGTRPFDSGVADIGGWGVGYLVGLFLLVASMALVLFGPEPGRGHARPVALGVGGTLLVLVIASYSSLATVSRLLDPVEAVGLDGDDMQVSVGRGFWCAVVGVALVLAAAWLARERAETPEAPETPQDDDEVMELTVTPEAPPALPEDAYRRT